MSMTIIQRAVLAIVKEAQQDKKDKKKAPGDVMRPEINGIIWETLDQLVEMGALTYAQHLQDQENRQYNDN